MINLLLNIRVRKSKTSFIKTQNDYLFPSICNCWQCQLKSTSASHEKQTKLQEFANRYTANKTSRKQGSETECLSHNNHGTMKICCLLVCKFCWNRFAGLGFLTEKKALRKHFPSPTFSFSNSGGVSVLFWRQGG